jgi:hypothetical protein
MQPFERYAVSDASRQEGFSFFFFLFSLGDLVNHLWNS